MEKIFTIIVLLFFAIHLLVGYGRRFIARSRRNISCIAAFSIRTNHHQSTLWSRWRAYFIEPYQQNIVLLVFS